MYFSIKYCFPSLKMAGFNILWLRLYVHQPEGHFTWVSFVFLHLTNVSFKYADIIKVYIKTYVHIWWLLFSYKTLRLDTLLTGSLGARLLECEARFSCHLKIIPYRKLVWDLTSLCKMELILEVSVTMVMDSSAMVTFTFTILLLFVLWVNLFLSYLLRFLSFMCQSQWTSVGYLWCGGFGQVTH